MMDGSYQHSWRTGGWMPERNYLRNMDLCARFKLMVIDEQDVAGEKWVHLAPQSVLDAWEQGA